MAIKMQMGFLGDSCAFIRRALFEPLYFECVCCGSFKWLSDNYLCADCSAEFIADLNAMRVCGTRYRFRNVKLHKIRLKSNA